MKNCMRIRVLTVFLAGLFVIAAPAKLWAQAVVSDTTSTGKTVKQWFTEVKESKTVVGTMDAVKKTSSAIGTAKKSVTEYVVKNKEKIEAKIAKVKEYKEKAEAYKKEYDEYKKMLDENIAKAKEYKEQAEQGLEMAKETASGLKDAAGSAVDMAKDKAGIKGDAEEGAPAETEVAADGATEPAGNNPDATTDVSAANTLTGKTTTSEATSAPALTSVSGRKRFEGLSKNMDEATLQDSVAAILEGGNGGAEVEVEAEQTFVAGSPVASAAVAKVSPAVSRRLETKAMKVSPAVSRRLETKAMKVSPAVSRRLETKEMKVSPAVSRRLETKAMKVSPAVQPVEKNRLRKAFTTSSLHQAETFAFAFAAALPDNGTDVNNVVVAPAELAKFSGLSSKQMQEPGKLDAALLKLNQERLKGGQSPYDAAKMYNRALAQYVAASIAEAYKARQDAEGFEEKFVNAVAFAPEPTAQDVYSNIVELNKAVDMEMNGLLKIFSTQLTSQALYNYGSYRFVPAEEEQNAGGDNE